MKSSELNGELQSRRLQGIHGACRSNGNFHCFTHLVRERALRRHERKAIGVHDDHMRAAGQLLDGHGFPPHPASGLKSAEFAVLTPKALRGLRDLPLVQLIEELSAPAPGAVFDQPH